MTILLQLHKKQGIPADEVKGAFELAESTSPGISDIFVHAIVQKLLPSISETRIRNAIDKNI